MRMTVVTIWPLVVAAIANVAIGMIWYHPKFFGSIWMRLSNITPEMAEKAKRMMPLYSLAAFLAGMVAAYVMNYFGIAWGVYDIVGAVELGFWCWAGFVAPTMLGQVLWDHRPFTVYLINASYWLVSFVVMAVILVI